MGRQVDLEPIPPDAILNAFNFPPYNEWSECENIYGTGHSLRAKLIRDDGETYHARPELSHSEFCHFKDEPESYFHELMLKQAGEYEYEESQPQKIGKEAEHVLFNGELLGNPVVVPTSKLSRRKRSSKWFEENAVEYDKDNPEHHTFAKSGAAYNSWVEENKAEIGDREILTRKQYADKVGWLDTLKRSIRNHSKAKALIYGAGMRHVAIVFTCPFTGILLRCQLDILLTSKKIVDYKTDINNKEDAFKKFYDWNYHIQATWYREAVRQLSGGEVYPVYYVASEKSSGRYIPECYRIKDTWFKIGYSDWINGLTELKRCLETNDFSRPTKDTIVDLEPPSYLLKRYEL